MAYQVKCPICGERFLREETDYIQKGKRYYHRSCLEKEQKKEDANSLIFKEQLNDIIQKIFKVSFVSPRVLGQIKKFKQQGYSYFGMIKTLEYWFILEKNSIKKANGGIGIVPYVYQDALNYYSKVQISRNSVHKIAETEVKVVCIDVPKEEDIFKKRKIDIDSL